MQKYLSFDQRSGYTQVNWGLALKPIGLQNSADNYSILIGPQHSIEKYGILIGP